MSKREFSRQQLVERSIIKKYRKTIWNPFVTAIKRYEMINDGDKIAVCMSGGKDSMLMAKLMQQISIISDTKFDVVFIVMDPGYNEENRKKIEDNASLLGIPLEIFETDIFNAVATVEKSPCYLCARMRRGYLYSAAKERGCNKIALGHHFSDVIETTVMGMFYGSQIQAMLPKLRSTNFEGMELIRPMYCINEEDIIAWKNYNELDFLRCACRFTEESEKTNSEDIMLSKRQEVKELIKTLKRTNPNIEKSIFNSIHNVMLDTMPGYKKDGVEHFYIEEY